MDGMLPRQVLSEGLFVFSDPFCVWRELTMRELCGHGALPLFVLGQEPRVKSIPSKSLLSVT